jgi:hypothetical protein
VNREALKDLPRVKRIAGGLGVPSCSDLSEGHVGVKVRTAANWVCIKVEFGWSWNSFIVALELLELKLLDAQSLKKLKA